MATSANLPSGAVAANGTVNDPFTSSPSMPPPSGPMRYASFDTDQFSTYTGSSPSQARRALEAHLKDTDRRIQDASKLGTTLLQQRKNLASRLKEVEELSKDNDVPAELQQRLTELEKEYNDIGRESARAFLPKSKPMAADAESSVYSNSGRQSPTKAAAPSRRQRNQPTNRVHDIEFATEISTQLLAQVRQLQTALAEKDEELKDAATSKSQLENDHMNLVQRAKHLDENLQRHRDDNWNLETKIQDLETSVREYADREQRLNLTLKTTQSDKTSAQRDLEELKVIHEKATDEHTTSHRHQEADLHTLRRDAANHESEKETLHRKIEELTSQNTELAKAVSYRWNQGTQSSQAGATPGNDSDPLDDVDWENPDLISPMKGTPARSGMLESETLKSSLNHAHRMIQNLKNNIHREKTEKVELKRLLADARDELEKARGPNAATAAANMNKKRADAAKQRKPTKLGLGANRSSTTEIFEDEPDWEEHDDPSTPSRSLFGRPATGAAAMPGAFQETDTSDAFETADERRGDTATETEAFQTGAESMGEDSDLTETESVTKRPTTSTSRKSITPSVTARPSMPMDRYSYMSTASASGEEYDEDVVRTPVQAQGPKYRVRVSRGARRSSGPAMSERLVDSPASSINATPQPAGQSLGDELDALDDDDDSVEGTPDSKFSASRHASPETQRTMSVEPESRSLREVTGDETITSIEAPDDIDQSQHSIGSPFASPVKTRKSLLSSAPSVPKPVMVDSSMMTEPWAPEREIIVQRVSSDADSEDNNTAAGAIAGAAGGTLAGVALGRLSKHGEDEGRDQEIETADSSSSEEPAGLFTPSRKRSRQDGPAGVESPLPPVMLQHSGLVMQETEPASPEPVVEKKAPIVPFQQSTIYSQEFEPASPEPVVEKKAPVVPFQQSTIFSQETEPFVPEPVTEKKAPVVPFQQSTIFSQETEPFVPEPVTEKKSPVVPFQQSTIFSQETEPVSPPRREAKAPMPLKLASTAVPFQQSTISSQETEPISPPRTAIATSFPESQHETIVPIAPAQADTEIFQQDKPQELSFSSIAEQDFAPVEAHAPYLPRRSSRRLDALYAAQGRKDTTRASAPPGLYGEDEPSLVEDRSRSVESGKQDHKPAIPILTIGRDNEAARLSSQFTTVPEAQPSSSAAPHHLQEGERAFSNESMIPMTKPLAVKRPMAESGSQTLVSGDEIDNMMRNKNSTIVGAGVGAVAGAGAAAIAANSMRRSVDSGMSSTFQPRPTTPNETSNLAVPRPSSSNGTMRGTSFVDPPPLPADHNRKIAAAAQKAPISPSVPGAMGPPAIPASAYKHRETRPKTPVGGPSGSAAIYRPVSKESTTPRPGGRTGSGLSRQPSVSSFASELDERFNIQRGQFVYPDDMPPTTDPRMIQAITQTMIGEYLWKYTRKTGRNETSNSRHRRFFWVHPYTRTLYWSERDPSTAGKDMMKAKSMSIEAVRVITDDNTNPPGLHRKSVVVVTPGREIVFTAPTGQRHETWFNALSYLLLRTDNERANDDTIDEEEDMEEFNPSPHPGAFSFRRSISRMTGRSQSRRSLSSYNSRSRPSSPTKTPQQEPAQQQQHQQQTAPIARPALNSAPTLTPTAHDNYTSASTRSRLSSFTTKLRTGSQRGSFNSQAQSRPGAQSALSHRSGRTDDPAAVEGSAIYNASVVSDSAEDLRAVIERQERDADRLENVRACCDGKHDVGSLSRKGRQAGFGASARNRGHSHGPPGQHAHSHGHGHPRAEPIPEAGRSGRGE